jgi:hypothetical protein
MTDDVIVVGGGPSFQNLESATISGQRAAERLLTSHLLSKRSYTRKAPP